VDPSAAAYTIEDCLAVSPYSVEIPLERLRLGIDNLRYDVMISPEFIRVSDHVILQMIIHHARASKPLMTIRKENRHREISLFRDLCRKLMTEAVNRAKTLREVQIDYLCQVSIVKLLLERVNHGIDAAFQHFKSVVRKQEVSRRSESHLKLREEVREITRRRAMITREVCSELFSCFNESRKDVDELRALNFGEEWLLPGEFFDNPILYTLFHPEDFFMMNHYVLLGHRGEDALQYHAIRTVLGAFLGSLLAGEQTMAEAQARAYDYHNHESPDRSTYDAAAGGMMKSPENMDTLFHYPETCRLLEKKKKSGAPRDECNALRAKARAQKKLTRKLYKTLSRETFLPGILAAYEIEETVKTCCPPLMPQDVLRYAAYPKAQKNVARKIARFRSYSEKPPSMKELRRTAARIRWMSREKRRLRVIRFLRDFARYHRDLSNSNLYRETADCIHLLEEKKDIRLSRENNTLYEFILPREQKERKRPVINHVVLKADVRGSTEIIGDMKDKGLNPATNFSLNFFEPINHLITVFNAEKVFVEGDAVILSVSEHEGDAERWYGVARACGLAANILLVVKRLNHKNRKNSLPKLDLGIGISFLPAAPTFFYDGETPVMISPAINEADVLSRCDHALRRRFSDARPPFNLYVYQIDTTKMTGAGFLPSPVLRYNVMGIELAPDGFEKLHDEIYLKRIETVIPEIRKAPLILYTGKFPTASGNYQRIIIREEDVYLVSPENLSHLRPTGRKYYEVCTQPALYEYVKIAET